MKQYSISKIKNIAILGHSNSGKTTLADSVLCYGKATERIGNTSEGTAALDFDPEEKKRGCSVQTSVFALEKGDFKLNLIDAPGLFDFAGGVTEALSAADSAIIVLSGKSGLTNGAKKAFEKAKSLNKGIGFFIGKLDSSHAHFYRVISALVANYGSVICPVVVPYIEDETVKCYVDLIENKAFSFNGFEKTQVDVPSGGEIGQMRDMFLEAVASVDDALMEKYFGGEEFTKDEIISGLKKGIVAGDICPVYCGVQQNGDAISLFADSVAEILPSAENATYKLSDGTEKKFEESGENALFVFKTIADPFVGKLSYFKVVSGSITSDMKLKNNRTGEEERISKVMWLKGGKQEEADKISAGDIGSVSKLGNVLTGDTLSISGKTSVAAPIFPKPTLKTAIYPANKGDEEKISSGLNRLMEEDRTISLFSDTETKEQVISTLGEQHLDLIVSKLKTKFGIDVVLSAPKIAYRETIRKPVKAQGRHKKQSGGHGQFGDVIIEFEPTDSLELVFEEKVFGGAVPKNFFPAVEKGLRESTAKGVLAGYPMVGIKATLVDGSYHPVDSSEMAFKTAASIAFKEGISAANPVLMEPIGTLKVSVEDDVLGDIIGDINKRRGRIIGMNPLSNKMQEVVGEVPMAEMSDFSTAMRSITGGSAEFDLEFVRYEDVPQNIADKIIAESKPE
ncbi:MAG: elongation factor G [Clostridia bacterium]|nr:elongation factor G [Clostridia bacterium]